jgi:hypothetical protein
MLRSGVGAAGSQHVIAGRQFFCSLQARLCYPSTTTTTSVIIIIPIEAKQTGVFPSSFRLIYPPRGCRASNPTRGQNIAALLEGINDGDLGRGLSTDFAVICMPLSTYSR